MSSVRCKMTHEYRIKYSYVNSNGVRLSDLNYLFGYSFKDAEEVLLGWYSDLPGFRIDAVWIARNGRWEVFEW